ncbi:MAG TPA: hypothetical protein VI755_11705 [Anaerolineales bacterium]|nr:hypothetical protein [Anaerolineales bacterium]
MPPSLSPFAPRGATDVAREPVICQRCSRAFANFVLEEIQGITQLRCGDLLITRQEANCLHCGWTFHWNIRERDVERMALVYGQLMAAYMPE